MNFQQILDTSYFGNSVENVSIALGLFVGIYVLIYLFKVVLAVRLKSLVSKTKTNIDDIALNAVLRLVNVGGILFALYVSKTYLSFPESVDDGIGKVLTILGAVIITWVVQNLLNDLIDEYFKRLSKSTANTFVPFLKNILKIFLWLIVGIFVLSNLGYTVSSLAAGVGISGLAVALAVRPTLESFFASVSIFTNRPFALGDYIQFNGQAGTVSHIGLRTSNLKTSAGTELVVPNTELVNATVENVAKRSGQRIDASIGLEYDTTSKGMEKGIQLIKDTIASQEATEDDIRVWFDNFGDSALIIRVIYFVDASLSYVDRMEVVSQVNFGIKKAFEKAKLEMAFPTQTVYVKK